MTALVILFVVLVTLSIALSILKKLVRKWAQMPLFVYNYVGGKIAVCSTADYNAAKTSKMLLADKVMVPDVMVFSAESEFLRKLLRIYLQGVDITIGNICHPSQKVNDLFVPLISEGMMSFEQQKGFFVFGEQRPEKYVAGKLHSMLENDWRLRIAEWETEQAKLVINMWLSIFASIICGIAILATYISTNESAAREEQVAVYTITEGDIVRKTEMKAGAPTTLLLPSGEIKESEPLIRGKVVRVEPLSSSISYACIRPMGSGNTKDFCGFTSPTTKLGDELYRRAGVVQMWASNNRPQESKIEYNSPANFLLTKPDADALVATGKFRIGNSTF